MQNHEEIKACYAEPASLDHKAAANAEIANLQHWFAEHDEAILQRAVDWPACWGGQFRVSESGKYVTEEDFYEVLPTERDRNLYYCCCECRTDRNWLEVSRHVNDEEWLDQGATEYVESDSAVVFYTECLPGSDFTHDELMDMAQERPELFSRENLADWPDLVRPALDAGIDCVPDGEPTWYCSQEGFKGLFGLPELRAWFNDSPLARAFDTCEECVAHLEGLGIFERVLGSGDGVAKSTPETIAERASRVASDEAKRASRAPVPRRS